MTKETAIQILTEMNKWRRARPPYDDVEQRAIPYSSTEYGEALDHAISELTWQNTELQCEKARLDHVLRHPGHWASRDAIDADMQELSEMKWERAKDDARSEEGGEEE